jgi:hypothetical protein
MSAFVPRTTGPNRILREQRLTPFAILQAYWPNSPLRYSATFTEVTYRQAVALIRNGATVLYEVRANYHVPLQTWTLNRYDPEGRPV